jgi:hypothetical protein
MTMIYVRRIEFGAVVILSLSTFIKNMVNYSV